MTIYLLSSVRKYAEKNLGIPISRVFEKDLSTESTSKKQSTLNLKGLKLRILLVAWSVAVVTTVPHLSTVTFPVEDGPEDGPGCNKE